MTRLRTVSPSSPGWTRRRCGAGFRYLDEAGNALPDDAVARIRGLAIPPAWEQVWICPAPNGHIQAVGVDAAGRRQYLYHPDWRAKRDREKFDRVLRVAPRLPVARETVREHLGLAGMPLERATATAVRLLDLGYFRIGSDVYTDDNGSFGLTTLEKRHVSRYGDSLRFAFLGKSGKEHRIRIDDPLSVSAVETMRRRRGGGDRLLAYKVSRRWSDLDAPLVNEYLHDVVGEDFSAKDFRTWHATVLAAAALAGSPEPGRSRASRRRAVRDAMREVAAYLGNTPTIARSSYVDPRVVDRYESGETIAAALQRSHRGPEHRQRALERSVLELLS